jgi:hypothetical protein
MRVRPPRNRDQDAGSGDYEYVDEDEEDEDDDDDEDGLWWPSAAKHQPGEFKKFFSCPSSSVLCYTFAGRASQGLVPESEEPPFSGRW